MIPRNILFERLSGGLPCCENGVRIEGFVSFEVAGLCKFNRIPVIVPENPGKIGFSIPTVDYFADRMSLIDFDRDGIFGEIIELIYAGLIFGSWDSKVKIKTRTIKSKEEFLLFHGPSIVNAEVLQ